MRYLLKVYDQEKTIAEIKFDTFLELLLHLIDRTDHYFYWSGVDEKDCKGLPRFNNVETVEQINQILKKHCYKWYQLKVYKI